MKTILVVLLTVSLGCASVMAQQPMPPNAKFEVGFSPNAGALDLVLKGIGAAQESVLMACYSFTSKPVADALVAAHKRGVKVQVVADGKLNAPKEKYSAVRFLANLGVPVRLNDKHEAAHHKFLVLDGRHVATGSMNYSAAGASRNAENVILLWNVRPLADQYIAEWKRLWREGKDVSSMY